MSIDAPSIAANESAMLEAVREVVGSAVAGKAFGDPIIQDGMVVLPAASVGGGMGGGSGQKPADSGKEGSGIGGGLGLTAKALGVFVIRDGKVTWRPAVDVTRIILGGQIVGIVALLTLRALLRARGAGTTPRPRG